MGRMRAYWKNTTLPCSIIILAVLSAGTALAQKAYPLNEPVSFAGFPAKLSLDLFRWGISPIDGHRCPMQPSCSSFASRSIALHGGLRGTLMAFDRLHRCGHDLHFYHSISESDRVQWEDLPGAYWQASDSHQYAMDAVPSRDSSEHTQSGFPSFLAEVGGREILLLEYYRLIYEHLEGVRQHAEFDSYVVGVGRILSQDSSRSGASLKWYLLSSNWNLSQGASSKLRLYGCLGLLHSNRWEECSVILTDTPFNGLRTEDLDAWRSARALTWVHLGEWEKAAAQYRELRDPLIDSAYLSDYSLSGVSIPKKSPKVAGVLSLLPGMGYAYSSHYKTAIAAVIVIGLSAAATIEASNQGNDGLAVSAGLLTIGWYSGSMFGAVESAKRYNEYHRERFYSSFPDVQLP